MSAQPSASAPTPDGTGTQFKESVSVLATHTNTEQEVIQITVDRLRLRINDHCVALESSRDWQGSLAVFLGIVLTLLTADFKDARWVPKATWHAVFLICAVIFGLLTVHRWRVASKKPKVDELIAAIKRQERGDAT